MNMADEKCPICGGPMFWRRYNTPIFNGPTIHTTVHGCQNCHTATEVENVEA